MHRNTKSLEGLELRASNGTIGKIKDVYFDDAHWHLRYFVVSTGSWLNGRVVLISPSAITEPRYEEKLLATNLTQEQVRNSPPVDTAPPVSRQEEMDLHRYYAWPYYWNAPGLDVGYGFVEAAVAPSVSALRAGAAANERRTEPDGTSLEADRREAVKGDPHLRSANALRGYKIEARDGAIGHVKDFVVDDRTWAVCSLLIDTRNWWPGKEVLVPLSLIRDIDWMHSRIDIDLTRELIKRGLEPDEVFASLDDYTDQLEAHYQKFAHQVAK